MFSHFTLGTNDLARAEAFYSTHYYAAYMHDQIGNKLQMVYRVPV